MTTPKKDTREVTPEQDLPTPPVEVQIGDSLVEHVGTERGASRQVIPDE